MTKKLPRPARHVPQRTCVGCREVWPKRQLMRVVRGPGGLAHDPTGKAPGRGAYLHDRRTCWQRALAGALATALKTELTEADRAFLQAMMATLPPEGDATDSA